MKRYRSPEEAIQILAECDRLLSDGEDLAETCRKLGISESTWYRWRARFGGKEGKDAKRIDELEQENRRLKNIVVELSLKVDRLKDMAYDDQPTAYVSIPSTQTNYRDDGAELH